MQVQVSRKLKEERIITIMQVQASSNLNFTGKKEVLYNLGKALDETQSYMVRIVKNDSGNAMDRDFEYSKSVRGYLDKAMQDSDFAVVMKNIQESINSKIEGIKGFTLREIANLKHRGVVENRSYVESRGVRRFSNEVRNVLDKNGLDSKDFDIFIKEIEPESLKELDKVNSANSKAITDYIKQAEDAGFKFFASI